MILFFFSFFFFIIISLLFFKNNFKFAKIIFICLYLIFLFIFLLITLLNPGILSLKYFIKNKSIDKYEFFKNYDYCKKCNIYYPRNLIIKHCYKCNICIIKRHHHCIWLGKCIGKYNLILFYMFLSFFFIYILSSLFIILMYSISNDVKKN